MNDKSRALQHPWRQLQDNAVSEIGADTLRYMTGNSWVILKEDVDWEKFEEILKRNTCLHCLNCSLVCGQE